MTIINSGGRHFSRLKLQGVQLQPLSLLDPGSALSKQGIKEARSTKLHLNINNYNSHKNYLRNSQLAQKSLTKRCHGWHQAARWTESCVSTTSMFIHMWFEKNGADLTYGKHKFYHAAGPLTLQIQFLIVEIYISKINLCFWNVIEFSIMFHYNM